MSRFSGSVIGIVSGTSSMYFQSILIQEIFSGIMNKHDRLKGFSLNLNSFSLIEMENSSKQQKLNNYFYFNNQRY
jgi:hypothetical protein